MVHECGFSMPGTSRLRARGVAARPCCSRNGPVRGSGRGIRRRPSKFHSAREGMGDTLAFRLLTIEAGERPCAIGVRGRVFADLSKVHEPARCLATRASDPLLWMRLGGRCAALSAGGVSGTSDRCSVALGASCHTDGTIPTNNSQQLTIIGRSRVSYSVRYLPSLRYGVLL